MLINYITYYNNGNYLIYSNIVKYIIPYLIYYNSFESWPNKRTGLSELNAVLLANRLRKIKIAPASEIDLSTEFYAVSENGLSLSRI